MDLAAEKKKFIAVSQVRYGQALAKGFHVSGTFMDGNPQKRWLGWLECVKSRESEEHSLPYGEILAKAAAKQLIDSNAENFVGEVFTIEADSGQVKFEVIVTTQRVGAKSPGEVCKELQQRLAEIPTRREVEDFLVQYHEQVWEAASDAEMNIKPSVDYDEAGRELAKAFLSRFQ